MTEEPLPVSDQEIPVDVPPPPPTLRLRIVQVSTVVIVIVALGAGVYFRDRIQDLKQYGYVAVFLVSLISNATVILPLPGLAINSVMGGVFNPWIVGLVGGTGQALGELTGYMAGYSGQTWVDENPTYDRLARWMQRRGLLTWPASPQARCACRFGNSWRVAPSAGLSRTPSLPWPVITESECYLICLAVDADLGAWYNGNHWQSQQLLAKLNRERRRSGGVGGIGPGESHQWRQRIKRTERMREEKGVTGCKPS
jgi:hypothetical protein